MKKQGYHPDFDTLTNPSPNRMVSIICFMLSVVIPLLSMLYLFSHLPESERIITHWDADGKPNGWQSASSLKAILLLVYFISITFALGTTYLCYRCPALHNTYRGSLFNKFLKLKAFKIWYIKSISWLDITSIINTLVGIFMNLLVYQMIASNLSQTKEFPIYFHGILIAIGVLFIPFLFFWEPHRKTITN